MSGFVGGDDMADATSGALVWSAATPPHPRIGSFAIDGVGLSAQNYTIVQAAGNETALTVKADPSEAAPSARVDGLVALALTPVNVATPYGVGSNDPDGNNTGNARRDPDPTNANRRLADFSGRLALTVVGGGVRLPESDPK